MKIFKILKYPNIKLKIKAIPVKFITTKIKKIITIMINTMNYYHGIGLASTQININLAIIVIKHKKKNLVMLNPKIINKKGKINSIEGCLSIPNRIFKVKRFKKITVISKNIYGKLYKMNINNDYELSICIQHEIDHLNGILCIDRI